MPSYTAQLRRLIDFDAIASSDLRVLVDPMYGAASGLLSDLLSDVVPVVEIRGERNPLFPGINPEPIGEHLAAAAEAVVAHDCDVALVTDGDGDRIGLIDAQGRIVDAHRTFAILLRHLVEDRGWQGDVVKTYALTEMVDRLAERYERRCHIRPVGFKHVVELALSGDVLIGGEESGGIGVKNHVPERDGVLCCLLILERLAQKGTSLADEVRWLTDTLGPHVYRRADLRLPTEKKESLMSALENEPPAEIGDYVVSRVDMLDGVKLFLDPEGWILFRPSGTEPVVRVYAEGVDEGQVEAALTAGRQLAESGGASKR